MGGKHDSCSVGTTHISLALYMNSVQSITPLSTTYRNEYRRCIRVEHLCLLQGLQGFHTTPGIMEMHFVFVYYKCWVFKVLKFNKRQYLQRRRTLEYALSSRLFLKEIHTHNGRKKFAIGICILISDTLLHAFSHN